MYLQFNMLAGSDALDKIYESYGIIQDWFSTLGSSVSDNLGNFFDTVINFLTSIYSFILNLATRSLSLVYFLGLFNNVTNTVFNYVWAPIGLCAAVVMAVAVVKVIAGWGNT